MTCTLGSAPETRQEALGGERWNAVREIIVVFRLVVAMYFAALLEQEIFVFCGRTSLLLLLA